jgi:glycosyltransferase involved in cell wall biosynthesis
MKVLRINTSLTQGGAALSALNIQKAVCGLGVESLALCARDLNPLEDNNISLGEGKSRLAVNAFAYRVLGIEGIANHRLWRKILARLDEFDLIHLHNVHGYYMPYGILERFLMKPCVWTLHDYWLVTGGPGFPFSPSAKKSKIGQLLPFANFSYPAEWIDRSTSRRMKLLQLIDKYNPSLVAVSSVMAEKLRSMGLASSDLHVIPHGLYESELGPSAKERISARQRKCWPLDKHVFLFSSAQVDNPMKGCDVFLGALEALPDKDSWVAYVAGARSDTAKRRVSELGLDVRFLGKVDEITMRECYRACDTYVSSTYDETFGRTIVEALAEGANVVCTDLPVLREVSGGSAVYFPAGDVDSLSQELCQLLNKSSQLLRCHIARKTRRLFSYQIMARKYVDLYKSEIRRKRLKC